MDDLALCTYTSQRRDKSKNDIQNAVIICHSIEVAEKYKGTELQYCWEESLRSPFPDKAAHLLGIGRQC